MKMKNGDSLCYVKTTLPHTSLSLVSLASWVSGIILQGRIRTFPTDLETNDVNIDAKKAYWLSLICEDLKYYWIISSLALQKTYEDAESRRIENSTINLKRRSTHVFLSSEVSEISYP